MVLLLDIFGLVLVGCGENPRGGAGSDDADIVLGVIGSYIGGWVS